MWAALTCVLVLAPLNFKLPIQVRNRSDFLEMDHEQ